MTGRKGGKIWSFLLDYYCRVDRYYHICGSTGTDPQRLTEIPDVVHYGVMQSRTIALFYCLLAFSHCIAAILRGSGNASVPMIVMLCDWCLFRVKLHYCGSSYSPGYTVIFRAYPLTWGISSVIFCICSYVENGFTDSKI